MTTYMLHGGICGEQTENNKLYYQEMVKGLDDPNILLVYFARELDEYEVLKNRDKANFQWANPEKTFTFTIANEENFVEQAKNSDVIFFCGGVTNKLIKAVQKQDADLKELFEGKIISGSSAGANMLSEWFYGHGAKEVDQGLGILSVTVFAHYKAGKDTKFWLSDERILQIEEELKEKSGRSEIICLPEQKFVTIES